MMRMVTAAYALCAALLLTTGMFGSTPADAGYYRGGYQRTAYYRGPRGGVYGGGPVTAPGHSYYLVVPRNAQ